MGDQYKNVMIAIFVLAATSIVTFLLMFIHPTVGDEKKTLIVRFPDIDKVSEGTRVTYGGKPVGEVVDIREIPGEKTHRYTRDGKVYLYELELKVDSSVNIFNTDEVSLRTSGLLGEKSVSINPFPPKPGEKIKQIDAEVIYANESGSVEQTFKEFKEVADKLDVALDNINRIMDDLQHEHTFRNIAKIASNIADISEALNKPKELSNTVANIHHFSEKLDGSWINIERVISNLEETTDNVRDISIAVNQPDNLSETVENVHAFSDRLLGTWDTVEVALGDFAETTDHTKNITEAIDHPEELRGIVTNVSNIAQDFSNSMPRVTYTISELSSTAANANNITYRLNEGEGALGRILASDEIYLHLISLLNKGEVIFDDINHYGLLFHSDKNWQRLRARRMNLLAKLCTPQEFRNFFNDEIDNITTSLERVNMVLDKNECLYPCGLLIEDNDFTRVYAELLRRVTSMEEALKMYNTQLVEYQLPRTEIIYSECP
ncbi:MAG: MlaD family protein [Parachlamydiales bacterium]|jgi:phospholipid/cholesterol/gamma-HCH transport system substrate-binding protein